MENHSVVHDQTQAEPQSVAEQSAQGAPSSAQEPVQEPMYSRAEMQRELDRVAKKERERGRRQALRQAQQADPHAQGQTAGGAALQTGEPTQIHSAQQQTTENAQNESIDDAPDSQAQPEQAAPAVPAEDALGKEEQRLLGHAQADKIIEQGDGAIQSEIERLVLCEKPLSMREEEKLFWLFNHASLKACAEELTKRGVDGDKLIQDPDFIAFAELMRGDVPLLQVYEQYARIKGTKPKPVSTGSVQGQGPAGAPYFSQEEVKHMTRKQVRAHYDQIEKSRRFWR